MSTSSHSQRPPSFSLSSPCPSNSTIIDVPIYSPHFVADISFSSPIYITYSTVSTKSNSSLVNPFIPILTKFPSSHFNLEWESMLHITSYLSTRQWIYDVPTHMTHVRSGCVATGSYTFRTRRKISNILQNSYLDHKLPLFYPLFCPGRKQRLHE